jgi:hypothetical protein
MKRQGGPGFLRVGVKPTEEEILRHSLPLEGKVV